MPDCGSGGEEDAVDGVASGRDGLEMAVEGGGPEAKGLVDYCLGMVRDFMTWNGCRVCYLEIGKLPALIVGDWACWGHKPAADGGAGLLLEAVVNPGG